MFSPTRWILVPGLCASLCGCLALKSDLAATQADLVQRLNDVEDNLATQNQQVVRGDVDGLAPRSRPGGRRPTPRWPRRARTSSASSRPSAASRR
jgi:hypothetical protein